MAQNKSPILLGFDDEIISDKYKGLVNFTTNKIGGTPNYPSHISLPTHECPLCQLSRLLVAQIYAPLENSTYHRTLYIFACINPNCWNQHDSWLCLRVQSTETINLTESPSITNATARQDWCPGADDWSDDADNGNLNEKNGNLLDNKHSDEDDESYSFEETFAQLCVDEKNANEAQGGGAVGRQRSPIATAELEGNEGEVISVDSPIKPITDLNAIMRDTAPLPVEIYSRKSKITPHFISFFINVAEESTVNQENSTISDRHVRELLQEYQQNNADFHEQMGEIVPEGGDPNNGALTMEQYERATPRHGDVTFHCFSSRLRQNPGQILRYSRDNQSPLLPCPLPSAEIPAKCRHCAGEMTFELQLLPTLIPKLRLETQQRAEAVSPNGEMGACGGADFDQSGVVRLEFGNVLLFTCRKSCWGTQQVALEEAIVVQREI